MKETLEEAAQRLCTNAYIKYSVKDNKLSLNEQIHRNGGFIVGFKEGMVEGIKWQYKRMYSEEDMRGMYDKSCGLIGLELLDDQTENDNRFKEILEKFKKKK